MSTLKVAAINNPSASSGGLAFSTGGNVTGAGLDLVVPTSIANSGGSASASGGAITFTGVTSVSLNGVFTSTYDNYRIVFYITAFSAAADYVLARMRVSGSDASTVAYYAPRLNWNGTSTSTDNATATSFVVGYGSSTYPTAPHGQFDLIRPAAAEWTRISSMSSYLTSGGNPFGIAISGSHIVATAYDGITLLPGSGSMSGVIRVYGYKNS